MTLRHYALSGGIVFAIVLVVAGSWLWVATNSDPLAHPFAQAPIPIACVDSSCITTRDWRVVHHAAQHFAQVNSAPAPLSSDSLTTVLRQRLVQVGTQKQYVFDDSINRYRTEVLGTSHSDAVHASTGLSVKQYDELVIRPLLEQEALMQQREIASADQLFTTLTQEHTVMLLLPKFTWDPTTATVTLKNTASF